MTESVTVYAPHHPNLIKFIVIRDKMKELGAPILRVVRESNDTYRAIEGSHRLAAASALGSTVRLLVLDPSQKIDRTDWQMPNMIVEGDATANDLVDFFSSDVSYRFDNPIVIPWDGYND